MVMREFGEMGLIKPEYKSRLTNWICAIHIRAREYLKHLISAVLDFHKADIWAIKWHEKMNGVDLEFVTMLLRQSSYDKNDKQENGKENL